MKRNEFVEGFLIGILACIVIYLLVGCSGGGSSSGGGYAVGTPAIQFSLDNTSIHRGQWIYGTIAWNDPDGDITTLYVEEYFGFQRWDYSYSASQLGIYGKTGSRRIVITTKNNATPGVHKLKFYFRDAKGQQSNIIEIDVTVYAMDNAKELDNQQPLFATISN